MVEGALPAAICLAIGIVLLAVAYQRSASRLRRIGQSLQEQARVTREEKNRTSGESARFMDEVRSIALAAEDRLAHLTSQLDDVAQSAQISIQALRADAGRTAIRLAEVDALATKLDIWAAKIAHLDAVQAANLVAVVEPLVALLREVRERHESEVSDLARRLECCEMIEYAPFSAVQELERLLQMAGEGEARREVELAKTVSVISSRIDARDADIESVRTDLAEGLRTLAERLDEVIASAASRGAQFVDLQDPLVEMQRSVKEGGARVGKSRPEEAQVALEVRPHEGGGGTSAAAPAQLSDVDDESGDEFPDPADQEASTAGSLVRDDFLPPADDRGVAPERSSAITSIAPISRGGRPRGASGTHSENGRSRRWTAAPEVVCHYADGQWVVGVDVHEDVDSDPGIRIFQRGERLRRHDRMRDIWLLHHATGSFTVTSNGEQMEYSLGLPEAPSFLAFKCREGNDAGRQVRSFSKGRYILVVPAGWAAQDESAPLIAEPQPTSLATNVALFFNVDGEAPIIVASGSERLALGFNGVELVGTRVDDANSAQGPLFTMPPSLRAVHSDFWAQVSVIVVGEEGAGRGRWRDETWPEPELREQSLAHALESRASGWFFVRVYNRDSELLDSCSFRLVRSLEHVIVQGGAMFPGSAGHADARITFIGNDDLMVQRAGREAAVDDSEDGRSFSLSRDVRSDLTRWRLSNAGASAVEVSIPLPRLWWSLGESETSPRDGDWMDSTADVPSTDLSATSKRALWLRLAKPGAPVALQIGFEQSQARTRELSDRHPIDYIRLKDLYDAPQVQAANVATLRLWSLAHGASLDGIPIARVIVRQQCRTCQMTVDAEADAERDHIRLHLRDLAPALKYSEVYQRIREERPSLPVALYQCHYCDFYARSDDPKNPTNVIDHHVTKDCLAAGPGLRSVRFRTVADVEEVRTKLEESIPHFVRCSMCPAEMRDPSEEDLLRHLFARHKPNLFTIL